MGCLFSYLWVLRVLCVFWVVVLYQVCVLLILSPSRWLVFHSLISVILQSIVNLNEVQLNFFSCVFYFLLLVLYLKSCCQTHGHLDLLLMLSSLHFTFRSMIHFELIFVKIIRSLHRFLFSCDVQVFRHFEFVSIQKSIAFLYSRNEQLE